MFVRVYDHIRDHLSNIIFANTKVCLYVLVLEPMDFMDDKVCESHEYYHTLSVCFSGL
jgi:hypothetical protein